MPPALEHVVRDRVKKLWLSGESRKYIAEECGIGAGSVANIVNEWKNDLESSDYESIRELAIDLGPVRLYTQDKIYGIFWWSYRPGYVELQSNLDSINSPSKYGLSFHTAESFKSNEGRDFTNWVAVPPSTIDLLTDPKNIVIRQGEERLISAEIETPLSNNVTSIKFDNGTFYSSNGLTVSTKRIQPPVFMVKVSPQIPVATDW